MAPTAITETKSYSSKFSAVPHKSGLYNAPTRTMGKFNPPNTVNVIADPTYPVARTPPARTNFSFDSMDDALAAFARGEFLLVMDDESRENEGDVIIAASHCTTEKMAWMIKHTR
jgi:3,4-dihydroxy 2-butanone 4-phosphate synthase